MPSKQSNAAADAGGTGCYVNVPVEMMSSQDVRSGVCAAMTNGHSATSRAQHQHHRPRVTAQPGYMQMTQAASVRSDSHVVILETSLRVLSLKDDMQ